MSDKTLCEHIGQFIKKNRMRVNKTQDELSYDAGISRSTLSLLEKGETVTLSTLIRVLRSLDQLSLMEAFETYNPISPLALLKKEKTANIRQRVRKQKKNTNTDWT